MSVVLDAGATPKDARPIAANKTLGIIFMGAFPGGKLDQHEQIHRPQSSIAFATRVRSQFLYLDADPTLPW
jgi:hypothetical protein